jgi:hypothetical protein
VTTGQPATAWRPSAKEVVAGRGADHRAADRADPRPLWVTAWGGANTLAQALTAGARDAHAGELDGSSRSSACTRSPIRTTRGRGSAASFPTLHYIDIPSTQDGGVLSSRRGRASAATDSTATRPARTSRRSRDAWVDANIRSKGPLGTHYPRPCCIHEGDTPSFLGLIDGRARERDEPDVRRVGRRYVWRRSRARPRRTGRRGATRIPQRQLARRVSATDGKTYVSDQATIWRWRKRFQHDFAARMDVDDRAVRRANHNPVISLNGRSSDEPLQLSAQRRRADHARRVGARAIRDGNRAALHVVLLSRGGNGNPGHPVAARSRAPCRAAVGAGTFPSAPWTAHRNAPPRVTIEGRELGARNRDPARCGRRARDPAVEDSGSPGAHGV